MHRWVLERVICEVELRPPLTQGRPDQELQIAVRCIPDQKAGCQNLSNKNWWGRQTHFDCQVLAIRVLVLAG